MTFLTSFIGLSARFLIGSDLLIGTFRANLNSRVPAGGRELRGSARGSIDSSVDILTFSVMPSSGWLQLERGSQTRGTFLPSQPIWFGGSSSSCPHCDRMPTTRCESRLILWEDL
jgi:hypothetical protein